ncbi:cobalt-precorrin 5A hydrolase [Desulforamulus ruminis]|uniref:Cobalamin (Vitamin B12) biosynthesis CbiG protein n=1 Tax=Desulforamulus ruminis (strain ATCC 23193 / DSM 2154 / NCIMB 8452 / DL) TaxID=696281 RepID=F6DJW5_DESRL|nr:cobalt-precorrin 5A hydrolase [Desulforamulus ruminis]AEG59179.1 cobalamin (vitamin B12) biosynthesis CbiG protein [Desulforamulus ruminis DSM 2154]
MDTARTNAIAVLALTRGGARLAGRLGHLLPDQVHLYLPRRLCEGELPGQAFPFDRWQQAAGKVFAGYRRILFIMASGIVVRTLAPLLDSKQTDPAVVVLDEKGRFAISLLSGHLGGANELARQIAEVLGAMPVITTATDVNDAPALDLLARELACRIYPPSEIKRFNRFLVEGEQVILYSRWALSPEYRAGFTYIDRQEDIPLGHPVVYITNRIVPLGPQPRLLLRPRNLVVGVGCRRGVKADQIIGAIKAVFKGEKLSLLSLQALATVDVKMKEPGLLQAAEYFKVPLVEVGREQIEALSGQFAPSDFVKQSIGVGGVCEPAAMTASGQGKIIIPKQKMGPVTVAVAEAGLQWWG